MHTRFIGRKFVRITDAAQGNLIRKLNDVTETCGVQFKIEIRCIKYLCKQVNGNEMDLTKSGVDKWRAFGMTFTQYVDPLTNN